MRILFNHNSGPDGHALFQRRNARTHWRELIWRKFRVEETQRIVFEDKWNNELGLSHQPGNKQFEQ